MVLLEAREGYARVSVRVQERFLNSHGIAHGTLVFAVADAAFAVAVNADRLQQVVVNLLDNSPNDYATSGLCVSGKNQV